MQHYGTLEDLRDARIEALSKIRELVRIIDTTEKDFMSKMRKNRELLQDSKKKLGSEITTTESNLIYDFDDTLSMIEFSYLNLVDETKDFMMTIKGYEILCSNENYRCSDSSDIGNFVLAMSEICEYCENLVTDRLNFEATYSTEMLIQAKSKHDVAIFKNCVSEFKSSLDQFMSELKPLERSAEYLCELLNN